MINLGSMFPHRRISIFTGHYGSGKTNLAINWALHLRGEGVNVAVADLDIVNPYYRTRDGKEQLDRAGIRLICSPCASSNVDLPALAAETYALTDDRSLTAVMDVGGDDRGALALGRYVPAIREEGDYETYFVVNRFRPLTRSAQAAAEILREIEQAAGLQGTALVSNSNLGEETTAETVLSSLDYAAEVSALTGLPLAMTAIPKPLYPLLKDRVPRPFPIEIVVRQQA